MATDQKSTSAQLREAEEQYLKNRYREWVLGIVILSIVSISVVFLSRMQNGMGDWLDESKLMIIGSFLVILLIWYGLIRFWHGQFYIDKEKEKQKNPFRKIFFGSINVISLILLGAGIFISFVIMSDGKLFLSIAAFLAIVWSVIFLRYFMWSVYFYNINYGLTDLDWDKIFEKRENNVPESEIQAPKQNPYKDETFGLPTGTVRGMIAFTLLFGGLALLLASMDMDASIDGGSYYADHFEFFKTAFLMMIAFYFVDSSMKYLSKRWGKKGQQDEENEASEENTSELTAKKKALQAGETDASLFE